MSGGTVVMTDNIVMNTKQKTLSVAISRGMAPVGRIVVYCMSRGEIITDSLNFYVRDSRLETVSLL